MEDISKSLKVVEIKHCTLDELPSDILDDIFVKVSRKELISCLAVCTRFKSVIVSSQRLMNKVNSEN